MHTPRDLSTEWAFGVLQETAHGAGCGVHHVGTKLQPVTFLNASTIFFLNAITPDLTTGCHRPRRRPRLEFERALEIVQLMRSSAAIGRFKPWKTPDDETTGLHAGNMHLALPA